MPFEIRPPFGITYREERWEPLIHNISRIPEHAVRGGASGFGVALGNYLAGGNISGLDMLYVASLTGLAGAAAGNIIDSVQLIYRTLRQP